ncbi:MAG TPA: nuclear transport factor 2 family protein [Nitrospiraceae bacterium]|nr:nuclear transport factor 2 family protein [Nitrospiraceae bacterium]
MATTISAETVRRIFAHLETGSGDRFFAHVADDVDWTVQGTHPLAGHYTSKADFHAHTFARLNKILPGGTQLHVEQVFTDGDWAIVELRSLATAENGMRFDNRYCWIMRFKDEMIVEVRAYLDSALVQKLIDQNPV